MELKNLPYYKGKKASWQYVDYDDDMWTVAVKLTDERIQNLLNDHSVCRVKVYLDKTLSIVFTP